MNTRSQDVPRLRERLREETARAILAAAERVFGEEGLHAARMERIAAAAGVAVGTLYNHFADREALVEALCRDGREALLARVDAAVAAAQGRPAAEQLRAFLEGVRDHARARGPFLAVLAQAGEGPARARPPATLNAELTRRAEAIVRRGVRAGELRPDGHGVHAVAFLGITRALVVRTLERQGSWDGLVDAALDAFLRGAGR